VNNHSAATGRATNPNRQWPDDLADDFWEPGEKEQLDELLDSLTDDGIRRLTAIWESGACPTVEFLEQYRRVEN